MNSAIEVQACATQIPIPERGAVVYLDRRKREPGFYPRELHELAEWAADGRRAVIYHDDPNAFALLYRGDEPWASWAVSRQDGLMLVWDCVTFADIGRFERMADVLDALPCKKMAVAAPVPNVISLAFERKRRQPI